MKITAFLFCSLALAVALPTIWDTARNTSETAKFVEVVEASADSTAIINLLSGLGNLTLFAPNNAAFANATATPTTALLEYHVIGAKVLSTNIKEGLNFVNSFNKKVLEVLKDSGVHIIFGVPGDEATTSTVVTADVLASNGVIHIVDTVLVPPASTAAVATAAGLTDLVTAVTEAGIDPATDGVTIFAPTNTAFNSSTFGEMDQSSKKTTLEYHIVSGLAYSTGLQTGTIQTLSGDTLNVVVDGDKVTVNGATVIIANVLTETAVVHVIDSVLRVPNSPSRSVVKNLALQSDTTTLAAVVSSAGFEAVATALDAGTLTLFAPTNLALKGVKVDIPLLQYHLVPGAEVFAANLTDLQFPASALPDQDQKGGFQAIKVASSPSGVTVGTAKVTVPDLVSTKHSVVHVIDQVLTIPLNVVAVANSSGLSTLLQLVIQAGLVEAVQGPMLTILAPTNTGFSNYFGDQNVSAINGTDVQNLLLKHVIAGVDFSTDLKDASTVTALDGTNYTVTNKDGKVTVGSAVVVTSDVIIENGVVHVLDRVLGGPGPAPAAGNNELSAGAVVGIVIGVLAGVAIVGYCCFKSSNDDNGYKPM